MAHSALWLQKMRADLERDAADEALAALREVVRLDPAGAAFPAHQFEPVRIPGVGGAGTAILCKNLYEDGAEVMVKRLLADGLERKPAELFREAPGAWFQRSGGAPGEYKEVCATPAEIEVCPGEVYKWSATQGVTDASLAWLAHLRGLTALKALALEGCTQITDAGLAHLRGLTAVWALRLTGCQRITDAGLAHLRGLTALQWLGLDGCKRITDAGVVALQQALLDCKIHR